MPSILRIIGDYKGEEVANVLNVDPYEVNKKGDKNKKPGRPPYANTICKYDVSNAGFEELETQLADIQDFFEANYDGLSQLVAVDSITLELDVGMDAVFRNTTYLTASLSIPPRLMKVLGDLQVELTITEYWFDRYDDQDE